MTVLTTAPRPSDASSSQPLPAAGDRVVSQKVDPADPKSTGPADSAAGTGQHKNKANTRHPLGLATIPKRVRIRQKPQQPADAQLRNFLETRTPLAADDVRELMQRQAAGAWSELHVPTVEEDARQLNAKLGELSDAGQTSGEEASWNWRRDWLGLLCSFLFHLALLALLLVWVQPQITGDGPLVFQGAEDGLDLNPDQADVSLAQAQELDQVSILDQTIPKPFEPQLVQRPTQLPQLDIPSILSPNTNLPIGLAPDGGGLSGRRSESRDALVRKGGGDERSEQAVDLGLQWLARHQHEEDGGWKFTFPNCNCGNPGHNGTRTAATGLALLAFLGRNHNHVHSSEYQQVVLDGLNYLLDVSKDGDLTMMTASSMYGQGIATLALCEAYAISKDPSLKEPAQQAVDFIVQAQHPLGGWRYRPHEIGDINVTAWQLMALKTAKLAGLEVPEQTLKRAKDFVDSQATSLGYHFKYPGRDADSGLPAPSAIGLLLRMYEGWGPNRDTIRFGVKYLERQSVSANHMYYNYYATMVMFHFGGDEWKAWNQQMRDFLVNTQELAGHERGSWYFDHPLTGGEGGRLFNTVMGVLILEVYYRHLRLYEEDVLEADFPLD